MPTQNSIPFTLLNNTALLAAAVALIYLFEYGAPPASITDGVFERFYRTGNQPAELLGPFLRSVPLLAIAFGALTISAILLTRYYRWRPPAGRGLLLEAFTGAIPELVIVLLALYLFAPDLAEPPSDGYTFTHFPVLIYVLPAVAIVVFRLRQLSNLSRARAHSIGSIAQDLRYSAGDILRTFPALVLSTIIIVESVLKYQGAGHIFMEAVVTSDAATARNIAIVAVLFTMFCRTIGDIMAPAVASGPAAPATASISARFLSLLGGGLIVAWIIIAVIPGLISDHDPAANNFSAMLTPPGTEYPLGTDMFGRDVLSQITHGAQPMLFIVLMAAGLASTIVYAVSRLSQDVQNTVALATSCFIAIPALIFVPLFKLALNLIPAMFIACLTIYFSAWLLQSLKGDDDSGTRPRRSVIASALYNIAYLVGIVLTIDFFSIGTLEPTPSWGRLIEEGVTNSLLGEPWIFFAPAGAAVALMLGFTLLAYGIERSAPTKQTDDKT